MIFTKEQLQAAKQAKTPEELFQIAKQNNVELSKEKAAAYFEQLNREGKISDDELDNVSGGACEFRVEPDPKYNPGEMVKVNRYPSFFYAIIMEQVFYENFNEWYYKVYDTETKEILTAPEGAISR